MKVRVKNCSIELIQGDIADQTADMIVNAANTALAGGGGVDGAIHQRGGPAIMRETRANFPNGCPTGSAVVSSAGNLDAKWIAHAVAPIYRADDSEAAELLASAYRACFQLASEYQCQSIALPSLGTGAYAYPVEEASKIAVAQAARFATEEKLSVKISFVLFDDHTFQAFSQALQAHIRFG